MSILSILEKQFSPLDDRDKDWVQFVTDHKEFIKAQTVEKILEEPYLRPLKYKLERVIRAEGIISAVTWIVRLINDIPSNAEFAYQEKLLLPSVEKLKNLYTVYKSTHKA